MPWSALDPGDRSCYPDCGKHALTATDGSFVIDGVDPTRQFKVRVEAEGYRGQSLVLDPRDESHAIHFRLSSKESPKGNYANFEAKVLMPDGAPSVGA